MKIEVKEAEPETNGKSTPSLWIGKRNDIYFVFNHSLVPFPVIINMQNGKFPDGEYLRELKLFNGTITLSN